jgi:hypothetical protein
MATVKKNSNKVFVNGGKSPVRQADGTILNEDVIIVISEELAKYIGASYTVAAPAPKKILIKNGALKGRTITREHSVKVQGVKYELGYRSKIIVKKGAKRTEPKVKWIPIHIPSGINLRTFLRIIANKFSRKPALLKTPSGKTTAFVNI